MSPDPDLDLPRFPDGYDIATARLTLRPPALADVPALWPHMIDPRVSAFLPWAPHRDPDETRALVTALVDAQQLGRSFHWVVRDGDTLVGMVSLTDVRRTHRTWTLQRAELACWIAPDVQGRGVAVEASDAVMAFAFGPLRLHKLFVYYAADNASSVRTIDKLGFRLVGTERDAFCKDGTWHDVRHFELLASEYASQVRPSALTSR